MDAPARIVRRLGAVLQSGAISEPSAAPVDAKRPYAMMLPLR
jgi:hypothetical protein